MFPRVLRWLLVLGFAGGLLATAVRAWSVRADPLGVRSLDTGGATTLASRIQETVPPERVPTAGTAEMVEPWPKLLARLFLHVLATVFGLRAGMKIFYENAMLSGFVGMVLVDALVLLAMARLAPVTGGLTGMPGPQVFVSALVMMVMLHHFGFTKDRLTVVLAAAAAKGFGFLAEMVLRLLFLDSLLRYLAELGW